MPRVRHTLGSFKRVCPTRPVVFCETFLSEGRSLEIQFLQSFLLRLWIKCIEFSFCNKNLDHTGQFSVHVSFGSLVGALVYNGQLQFAFARRDVLFLSFFLGTV